MTTRDDDSRYSLLEIKMVPHDLNEENKKDKGEELIQSGRMTVVFVSLHCWL